MKYILKSTGAYISGKTVEIDGITYPEQAFADLDEVLPVKEIPSYNTDTHQLEYTAGEEVNGEWVTFNIREKTAEELAEQVLINRAREYPTVESQLDDLFHQGAFSAEMTAKIQAVKDKYPK